MAKYDKEACSAFVEELKHIDGDTSWIVFGYEGNNKIVPQAKGAGPIDGRTDQIDGSGVDEWLGNLNDDEVQFSLLKMTMGDRESKRPKFVMVTWIGPSVGVMKKAKAGMHGATVKEFIGQIHNEMQENRKERLTFNIIRKKVKSAMGADCGEQEGGASVPQKAKVKVQDSPAPPQCGLPVRIDAKVQSSGGPAHTWEQQMMTVHNSTDQILDVHFYWSGKWDTRAIRLQPNGSHIMKSDPGVAWRAQKGGEDMCEWVLEKSHGRKPIVRLVAAATDTVLDAKKAEEAAAAACKPDPSFVAELQGLRITRLVDKAQQMGVDEEAIEDALDEDAPKSALIELILAKEEVRLVAAATDTVLDAKKAEEAAAAACKPDPSFVAELQGLRITRLVDKAKQMGVDEEAIEDALDEDAPKSALIELILAKEEVRLVAAATDTVPEGVVDLEEAAVTLGRKVDALQQQLQQLSEQHSLALQDLPRRHQEQHQQLQRQQREELEELQRRHDRQLQEAQRTQEEEVKAQRRVQSEEIHSLRRQLEEVERRKAAVEERQRAEETRRQREAEQAKMVTTFTCERFADEATARRCLEQVDWDLEQAMTLYMPPVPDSPMSGQTLTKTSFKGGYDKATVPKGQLQFGGVVMKLIEAYCAKYSIPYAEDEGEHYFEALQAEAMTNPSDPIDVMAQRMWTSALQLRGREFCFILNDAVRGDAPALAATLGKITRAINQLCVTAGRETAAVHPPDSVCYRGAGFDDAYRSFFVAGRVFRQPAYLATSFSREVALRFLRRSTLAAKVLWIVHIDPVLKCVHVNLVDKSNVPGEEEYLFAPYSAFTVISAKWASGTEGDPHIIELSAAPDNKAMREDLELAPWS